ncbi:hypothetical protein L3Y34_006274 [Caenorhabditis briggsae]|uniref:Uncharacterized protein n=1 Tax=Caenorhabditis briggsae TaxID=6238 RepID=A0AAE9CZ66_CAEBR|nr:hypothetical protein L3Y34_006274 [Caenorhabditis briggsae]
MPRSYIGIKTFIGTSDPRPYCSVQSDTDLSNIALESSSSSSMETTTLTPLSKSCPQYFQLIERPSLQWCFSIGHKTNWTAMNQISASMVCQHLNATITGLETLKELELAKVKTMKDIIENCVTSSNLTDFRLPVFSEPYYNCINPNDDAFKKFEIYPEKEEFFFVVYVSQNGRMDYDVLKSSKPNRLTEAECQLIHRSLKGRTKMASVYFLVITSLERFISIRTH